MIDQPEPLIACAYLRPCVHPRQRGAQDGPCRCRSNDSRPSAARTSDGSSFNRSSSASVGAGSAMRSVSCGHQGKRGRLPSLTKRRTCSFSSRRPLLQSRQRRPRMPNDVGSNRPFAGCMPRNDDRSRPATLRGGQAHADRQMSVSAAGGIRRLQSAQNGHPRHSVSQRVSPAPSDNRLANTLAACLPPRQSAASAPDRPMPPLPTRTKPSRSNAG